MNVPLIDRNDFQLIDIDADGTVTLLDAGGETKSDVHLPNDCESDLTLAENIKAAFEEGKDVSVTVVAAMDKEAIKAYKISK